MQLVDAPELPRPRALRFFEHGVKHGTKRESSRSLLTRITRITKDGSHGYARETRLSLGECESHSVNQAVQSTAPAIRDARGSNETSSARSKRDLSARPCIHSTGCAILRLSPSLSARCRKLGYLSPRRTTLRSTFLSIRPSSPSSVEGSALIFRSAFLFSRHRVQGSIDSRRSDGLKTVTLRAAIRNEREALRPESDPLSLHFTIPAIDAIE